MQIRPYEPSDLEPILCLSIRAWAPVFDSIKNAMDLAVYEAFFPNWQTSQRSSVKEVCQSDSYTVFVAEMSGAVEGFVAVRKHDDNIMGEIYMIAVDPNFQKRGVGKSLTDLALDWMRDQGLSVAMVETGCDPGHGPARRTYQKAGFRLMPVARYFKKL